MAVASPLTKLTVEYGYGLIHSSNLHAFAVPLLGREWDLHKGELDPPQHYMTKFEIGPSHWVMDDQPADFERWRAGGTLYDEIEYPWMAGWEPNCRSVMQWLYNQRHIPEGRYMVEVSW